MVSSMTQDDKWLLKYQEVMEFIKTNNRNPSQHRIEEHLLLNWCKHQRKLMNAGTMKDDCAEKFKDLMELSEKFKRKNQYV